MIKALQGLTLGLVCSAGSFAQETAQTLEQQRGGGWKMLRLDLDITLLPERGKAEVTGKVLLELGVDSSPGPTLFMNTGSPDMYFLGAEGPEGTEIVLNQRITMPSRKHVRLARVTLASLAAKGDRLELEFAYESRDTSANLFVDQDIALASWVGRWYPTPVPAPGDNLTAGISSAVGTTTFHLPLGWTSKCNGLRVSAVADGDGSVEVWQQLDPVARSFAAGPYTVGMQEVDGREFVVYLLAGKTRDASEQAQSLGDAIGAMEEFFGEFPYPGYAIVEVPDGKVSWYASSHQGFLMAESGAFEFGANLPLFAHEAAHAWWGNLVNQTGDGGIVCSESLAQYGAVIAIENIEGDDAATKFLRFSRRGYSSQQCARGYFQLMRQGQDKPLAMLGGGGWQHTLSDAKGHWFFHMLRRRVGDELFFATLRDLIDEFTGKSMALNDIRATFIAAAPKESRLKQFFSQWLDRLGAPVLVGEFSQDDDHSVDLLIEQQQVDPYHLIVDVDLILEAGGRERHQIVVEWRETLVELQVSGKVKGIELDPDHRLLIWKPEYGAKPN